MPLKLSTASGGSVSIEPTNTASNYTLTVPAQTGTVAINGPAFSAYLSSTQTLSSSTWTKVTFQTEEFDTNSNYDNSTNYRFTPTVAGYYQISSFVQVNSSNTTIWISIYKNGSTFKQMGNSGAANVGSNGGSALVYLNGSTDYVEIYANIGTGQALAASVSNTYFQAFLARAA